MLIEYPDDPTDAFGAELHSFGEVHDEIYNLYHSGAVIFYDPDPAIFNELNSLLELRFFANLVEPTPPPPEMAFTSESAWSPDMGPLAVPFDRPNRREHSELRQITFTGISTGKHSPDSIMFDISGEAAFTVLTSEASCSGEATQKNCQMGFSGNSAQIMIEVWHPDFGESEYENYSELNVELFAKYDDGDWISVAQGGSSVLFARCDARLVDGIFRSRNNLYGLETVRQIFTHDIQRIMGLPGKHLYKSWQLDAVEYGFNINGFGASYTPPLHLVAKLDDVITNYARDENMELRTDGHSKQCTAMRVRSLCRNATNA